MSNPFFTVIVPSHNGADRIKKALDSCASQSFNNFELIVICDACDDNTADIARKYTDKVIEVNYHRDGLARNVGLDIASGEWVMFLDDDDWWLHEFVFQQMYEILQNEMTCDVLEYAVIWRTVGYKIMPPGTILPTAAAHVWRRSFISDVRFDDAKYSSDTHFIDELIKKKPQGLWTSMPMYYYNFMRPGSLTDKHEKGEI